MAKFLNSKVDDDDFIDILAIRKTFNFTPPPGLSLGLNKINPRYADILVPQTRKATKLSLRPKSIISVTKINLQDSIDEFSELTEQMRSFTMNTEYQGMKDSQTIEHPMPCTGHNLETQHSERPSSPRKQDSRIKSEFSGNTDSTSRGQNMRSRQIQNQYTVAPSEVKNLIFEDTIRSNITAFALDKYDHYILEKVLDVGNPMNMLYKERSFRPQAMDLRKNLLDERPILPRLKCIEVSARESKSHFLLFAQFILDDPLHQRILCIDKIGGQIIQKCLEVFDSDLLYGLLMNLQKNIVMVEIPEEVPITVRNSFDTELCTNQFGCLIVNKIIEIYPNQIINKNRLVIKKIIEKIINCSSSLSRRQYSNYIVQSIIEKGQEVHKRMLLDNHILNDFVSLSSNKYGSNVSEKAIIYGGSQWIVKVWTEHIALSDQIFKKLVNDHFANYVMQTVYDYLSPKHQYEFYQILSTLNQKSQLNVHGHMVVKYIDHKWQEMMQGQNQMTEQAFYYGSDYNADAYGQQINPFQHYQGASEPKSGLHIVNQ